MRNLFLGLESHEFDLATPLTPDEIIMRADKNNIISIPTGIKHGTVTLIYKSMTFEITTLRVDVKTDGRHAEVQFTNSWKLDASRRDLTFNAMYMDAEGNIYDYFNGKEDLLNGVVKFIGNPIERIIEDRLRILRFFRFYVYYGRTLDKSSKDACDELSDSVINLSKERITQEILRILNGPDIRKIYEVLHYKVFQKILGNNINLHYLERLEENIGVDIIFKLLNPDTSYLLLSNKFIRNQKLIDPFESNDPGTIKMFIANNSREVFEQKKKVTKIMKDIDIKYFENVIQFPLKGKDFVELTGQSIGEAIRYMSYWWYKQDNPTISDCRKELKSLISSMTKK